MERLTKQTANYDEAIAYLQPIADSATVGHYSEMLNIALSALREQAEREKGCVWCKEDNKVFHDGKHYHLFCSYCGKRLEAKP